MTISRATINSTICGIDPSNNHDVLLSVSFCAGVCYCSVSFNLLNKDDLARVKALMKHTCEKPFFDELEGKEIWVISNFSELYGFGDATKDQFVPLSGPFRVLSQEELINYYES